MVGWDRLRKIRDERIINSSSLVIIDIGFLYYVGIVRGVFYCEHKSWRGGTCIPQDPLDFMLNASSFNAMTTLSYADNSPLHNPTTRKVAHPKRRMQNACMHASKSPPC